MNPSYLRGHFYSNEQMVSLCFPSYRITEPKFGRCSKLLYSIFTPCDVLIINFEIMSNMSEQTAGDNMIYTNTAGVVCYIDKTRISSFLLKVSYGKGFTVQLFIRHCNNTFWFDMRNISPPPPPPPDINDID